MQVAEFKMLLEQLTGRGVRSSPSDDAFLTSVLKNEQAIIDCSQFNELLLICNKDRVEEPFFRFFFVPPGEQWRCRVRDIRDGVKKFQRFAMLCFGNFIYAFRELSR